LYSEVLLNSIDDQFDSLNMEGYEYFYIYGTAQEGIGKTWHLKVILETYEWGFNSQKGF
jgi:hypothetical protein